MAETQTRDAFQFYTQASKSWLDAFNSWTRMCEGYTQPFRGMDMSSWFRPYWDYAEDWGKTYGSMANTFRGLPLACSAMTGMGDAWAKGINSYWKMYEVWYRGMDSVAREAFEISRRITAGEEVETTGLLDAVKKTYNDVSSAYVESLKDTPFAEARQVDETIKRSMESFSDQQQMAGDYVREWLNFGIRFMKLTADATKEAGNSVRELSEKDTVSAGGYKDIIDSYAQSVKSAISTLRPPSMGPDYRELTDAVANWWKAGTDFYASWVESNVRLYRGMIRSSGEVSKASEEPFKEGKVTSTDDFYKRWAEAWNKATGIMVTNSQFNETVPRMIGSYFDCMKATMGLFSAMTVEPHPTRDDFAKMSDDLEKMKRSVEKKAKGKPEEVKAEEAPR